MPVVGRLGGAVGGPAALFAELERAVRGGAARPRLSFEGALFSSGVPARKPDGGMKDGGGALLLNGGGGVLVDIGGGVPLTDLGPARGGGGVAVLGAVFSAPGFLLTHRFRSGSYTKLLASPNLALMGLFGADMSGGGDSVFLPPPNHPEKPQLFLGVACTAARFAMMCKSKMKIGRR